MKFVQPNGAAPIVRGGSGVHQRPDWVKEWLANQGKYVALHCGHRTDLNDRIAMFVINSAKREVWCYQCGEASEVIRSIGLFEFKYGYPAPATPELPGF